MKAEPPPAESRSPRSFEMLLCSSNINDSVLIMKTNSGYRRLMRPVGGFISHHHPPNPVVAELYTRDRTSADGCAHARREVPVCLGGSDVSTVLVEVEQVTARPLMSVGKGGPSEWRTFLNG